ncbi:MAG: cysteine synthase family protein [Cellvibrionales bacterium]|nr:cysteine synthase family protein [Cellvibrionales bacterium]
MKRTITDYVGQTPLVFLSDISSKIPANIFLKLENMNPWNSVKDRIAKNIIEKAEQSGEITEKTHIIEATSGNTGISLAGVCASRGYKLTIVMPEFVSEERKLLLALMGANIVLTPESQGLLGPVAKSFELADEDPNSFIVDQTRNTNNPDAHIPTGQEIWDQLEGEVDYFVSASGTGGHLSGIGGYLKSKNAAIQVVAVEPKQAAVLSGQVNVGEAEGNHGIIGIGPGFIPQTLNRDVIDSVFVGSVDQGYRRAEEIIKTEGILIGVSTGAVIDAAIEIGSAPSMKNKNIVIIAASATERYLSTKLADNAREYLRQLPCTKALDKYMDMLK